MHFEACVQASFVVLMLTGGYAPCLPCWPISKIKLQGKIDGFDTDDLIVYAKQKETKECCKLLAQVKYSISITKNSKIFSEVIQAAWNDFNNHEIFNKKKDHIALITGPISEADTRTVSWLLDQARHTSTPEEFYRNVEQANFSPSKSIEKLAAFEHHLKLANNNVDVDRGEVYSFLNHFHLLGYDLGREFGICLSLLHSHISQINPIDPSRVWYRVIEFVRTWGQDAGTITPEKLPDDLKETFKNAERLFIPQELSQAPPERQSIDWNNFTHMTDIALANLIGGWDENNQADKDAISEIISEDYNIWILKIRDVVHWNDSPISLRNGVWKIKERDKLFRELGFRIFNEHLETFKSVAIDVLKTPNPAFEFPASTRYLASTHGKVAVYSESFMKALSTGLTLLGVRPDALVNCSQGHAEFIPAHVIKAVFNDADWALWGNLQNLLPVLAEGAPSAFLETVEKALSTSPCPFDELFAQEGVGITGRTYMSGLLWALEGLAWDESLLVRVCGILAELATHDPGGNYINRPANSLATILLPWLPQTLASAAKRLIAVKAVCKEFPTVGWKLLLELLPNARQSSSTTHKPAWRQVIPTSWEKGISSQEYWEQIESYSDITVTEAGYDLDKLCALVRHLNNLPAQAFNRLLGVLSSDNIVEMSEDKRMQLWEVLSSVIAKHRRFPDSKLTLSNESLSSIEQVAAKLAPKDLLNISKQLFSRTIYSKIYYANDKLEDTEKKIEDDRKKAIKSIFESGRIQLVLQFAESVESPDIVGSSLALIADNCIDNFLLPTYLDKNKKKLSVLTRSYIWTRYWNQGWSWIDAIEKSTWTTEQLSQLLISLPFCKNTWDRAESWLKSKVGNYWSQVDVRPYQVDGLDFAIDLLMKYNRPYAAIDCLYTILHEKKEFNIQQCVRVLLADTSTAEQPDQMLTYYITELIKYLQNSPDILLGDLLRIEWAYLALLEPPNGVAPKTLESQLANDPDFFCKIIQTTYRSNNEPLQQTKPSQTEERLANQTWKLLYEWRMPPGVGEDGTFNIHNFFHWFEKVKDICTISGHWEIAQDTIGKVLIHCPPDAGGLWIDRSAADILNARDVELMRRAFRIALYNSRGMHFIDPSGSQERELAKKYRTKAEQVENEGYQRLAATLRDLADEYDRDAQQISERYGVS